MISISEPEYIEELAKAELRGRVRGMKEAVNIFNEEFQGPPYKTAFEVFVIIRAAADKLESPTE